MLVSKTSRYPVSIVGTRNLTSGKFRYVKPILASPQARILVNSHRKYVMVASRILRGVLKIRYLLLGGAVTGGVTLQKVSLSLKNSIIYGFMIMMVVAIFYFRNMNSGKKDYQI